MKRLALLAITGLAVFIYFNQNKQTQETITIERSKDVTTLASGEIQDDTEDRLEINIPIKEIDQAKRIDGWKAYTNNNIGLAFSYPSTIDVHLPEGKNEKLAVQQHPLNLDLCIQYFGTDTALYEKYPHECLYQNEGWGELSPQSTRSYIRLQDKTVGQSYALFGKYQQCDVMFLQVLAFEYKDFLINFVLEAERNRMMPLVDQYFYINPTLCGENKMWNFLERAPERFYEGAKTDQIRGLPQDWYQTFEQLISTIELN